MALNAFHAGALNVNMSKFDPAWAVDMFAAKRVSVLFDFHRSWLPFLEEQERTGKTSIACGRSWGSTSPAIENIKRRPAAAFTAYTARPKPRGWPP
jgi:long-chain acyl-CoA synthetase